MANTKDKAMVLSDIVVIETAGDVAGPYCGRLLAAHGARVIHIDQDPQSSQTTLAPHHETTHESGLHAWLHAGKEGYTEVSDAALNSLLDEAQVLIHSGNSVDPLDYPHLIQCDISWYGRIGPYKDFQGNDSLIAALTGLVYGIGTPQGPPVIPSGYEPQILTGVIASIGILANLTGEQAGEIAVNMFESAMVLTEIGAVIESYDLPVTRARYGINRFPPTYPMGVFPCASGWIGITALTPSQWQGFCQLLNLTELAQDTTLNVTLNRLARADEINATMLPSLLKRDARELVEAGQALRVPLALVPTSLELLSLPEFVERKALSQIEMISGESFDAPGIPFQLQKTPSDGSGRAPCFDCKLPEITPLDTRPPEIKKPVSPSHPTKPLTGFRIIDLSMGWSGPLATRFLADLGADVIKVEACQYPDWWRGWEASHEWVLNKDYEKAPSFNSMNRNKRGITLDLTRKEGRDLLLGLVEQADALIENNTATVMPKLGLGYDTLLEVNPSLVMLSMPAFGWNSRWSHFRAYGSTVEQASGLPHLNGLPNWPPTHQHVALGDAVAGINAASALLFALYHRKQTGEGQFIDFSQVECLLPLAAHGIIHAAMNHSNWERTGNQHPLYAPQGIYPCSGEDQWVCISVTTEAHWQALAGTLGIEQKMTLAERRADHATLDEKISQWTRNLTPEGVMQTLQNTGVPAAIVRATVDLPKDRQLETLQTFVQTPGVHKASVLQFTTPILFNGERPEIAHPAPRLGEHTIRVLRDELELNKNQIASLEAANIIGSIPLLH